LHAAPRRLLRPTLAFLAAALAVRLPIFLASTDTRFSVLSDDAFYYLEAARRTVEGHGWPSMDGVHLTNGFHPLFMALLVVLQAVCGTDPARIVGLSLALNLALNAAAAYVLLRAVVTAEAAGEGGAAPVLVGALAGASVGWMGHGLSGVETSLSSLVLLVLALRWRTALGESVVRGRGPAAWDGLWAGLAILARTDAAVFVALGLGALVLARGGPRRGEALRSALVTAAVALLVTAPWWIANALVLGQLAQDSGAAIAARTATTPAPIRLAAMNLAFWLYRLGWLWGAVPVTAWLVGAWAPWDALRTRGSARGRAWLLPLLAAAACLSGNDLWYIDSPRMAAFELGLGAIAFAVALTLPRSEDARVPAFERLVLAWIGVLVLVYAFGLRAFQVWYTTGPSLVGVGLLTLPVFVRFARRHRTVAGALLVVVLANAALHVARYRTHGGFGGRIEHVLAEGERRRAALRALAAATPDSLVVGSFDSGLMSYLVHPFPIVNLDGVMNHGASQALTARALAPYVARERVTLIVSPRERIAEFQRVAAFAVVPDADAARVLGLPAYRVASP